MGNLSEYENQLEKQENTQNVTRINSIRELTPSSLFSVTQVTENLYLCGACALRADTFDKLAVSCVINCTTAKELLDTPLPRSVNAYHRIPVEDTLATNLSEYFHTVADIIHQVKENGGKTLIHCIAGVSRSASLSLAYLVKYHQMDLRTAYNHVKHRRACIQPNTSFFSQLIQFEREMLNLDVPSVTIVYDNLTQTYIPDVYEDQSVIAKLCCLMKTGRKMNFGVF